KLISDENAGRPIGEGALAILEGKRRAVIIERMAAE
ncbi:MAG: hypothetical protein JWN14_3297, partial [Chthonomonadales bacterium]|nr:hypothetical protein [Chthonomonadales bacterium]